MSFQGKFGTKPESALGPTPCQWLDSDSGSDSSHKKYLTLVPTLTPNCQKTESTPGMTPTPESESPVFVVNTAYDDSRGFGHFFF